MRLGGGHIADAAGGDIRVGGPGDDVLDGGFGLDTAIFLGAFADHEVRGTGTTRTVRDHVDDGGQDTLSAIELLQFDEGILDVRDDAFTPDGVSSPAVEAPVAGPGVTSDPEPLLAPVV